LSNIDKHQLLPMLLIPATSLEVRDWRLTSAFVFGVVSDLVSGRQVDTYTRPVQLGAEFRRQPVRGQPQPDVEVAGHVSPQVCFDDGHGVLDVVDRMMAVVVKIVREFDPIF